MPIAPGPISKSFPPHVTRLHPELLDALEHLGVPRNCDNVSEPRAPGQAKLTWCIAERGQARWLAAIPDERRSDHRQTLILSLRVLCAQR